MLVSDALTWSCPGSEKKSLQLTLSSCKLWVNPCKKEGKNEEIAKSRAVVFSRVELAGVLRVKGHSCDCSLACSEMQRAMLSGKGAENINSMKLVIPLYFIS